MNERINEGRQGIQPVCPCCQLGNSLERVKNGSLLQNASDGSFEVSGHDFSRAANGQLIFRLQPLQNCKQLKTKPQGLKPTIVLFLFRHD